MTEPRAAVPPELDTLELTIRRLLDAHNAWRRRAQVAEARARELEAALQGVSSGRLDPVALAAEAERLEKRNRALRERMDQAHAVAQRMAARLQFTEEER
ncbi:MAG: hypothetical protein WD054_00120 [Gemmatimonadota bacterium]